jgi:hypothetical protein
MVGTGEFTAEMRPTSFGRQILKRTPGAPAALTMLTSMTSGKTVNDPKFTHFEGDWTPDTAELTGTHNTTVTQINLDFSVDTTPAKKFRPGYIVRCDRTGESMQVTALDTTNYRYLTVIRGVGTPNYGVSGIAMVATDVISTTSSGNAEGADVPDAIVAMPSTVYNYCQIFRSPMHLTGTAMEVYLRTGKFSKEAKWQITVQQMKKLELARLFGARQLTTDATSGKPLRFAGGLEYFVTTNVTDFATTPFTNSNFMDFLRDPMTYTGSSMNKVALVGATANGAITEWAKAHCNGMRIVPTSETYGLKINEVITTWGTLAVMNHPLMTRNQEWSKMMFVVDLDNVKAVTYNNRKTKFLKNRQSPGADAVIHEWLGEESIAIAHEPSHAIGYGIEEYVQ